VFNSDTPISTHSISDFFLPSEIVTTQQIDSTAHKLKPRSFHKFTHLQVYLVDFHPQYKPCLTVLSDSQVYCHFWAVLFAKQPLHFKIASFHCNSSTSTPVPPLGTSFNTILYFSDHLAYLPNALWYSRQIHQIGQSSPRSLSSTIQPNWTALPVPGLSIVPVDNDPNWEDAPTTNPITNLTANRPISSTHS